MSITGTARSFLEAFGWLKPQAARIGCSIGKVAVRETKRSAQIANLRRPSEPLRDTTQARLGPLFPDLDLGRIRVRRGCRLPANRFDERGSTYAMTFGSTIYWRDAVLDEDDAIDLVKLIHEIVHVDQNRRLGGEEAFACAYGEGYVAGGGAVPAHIDDPTAYHRNPLEAEAYTFDSRFRDDNGSVVPDRLPDP